MKITKQLFYIVTMVLILTLVGLTVGSQIKSDIDTLTSITLESREQQTRSEMKSLLQVARESVMQNITLNKIDINTPEGIDKIVQESIKPLNIESNSSNIVLMRVQPDTEVLYQKRESTLPKELIDQIKVGIDSSISERATYTINNSDIIFEWVGIPPGIAEFSNGSKWVLIIVKDKSVIQNSIQMVLNLQNIMLYRLYSVLFISCLVVVTTVVTIYYLQKDKYHCNRKDNCPIEKIT